MAFITRSFAIVEREGCLLAVKCVTWFSCAVLPNDFSTFSWDEDFLIAVGVFSVLST